MSKFFIIATPIGNLEDISIRAIKTLLNSDIIICEDTRISSILINNLQNNYLQYSNSAIKPRLISLNKYNEDIKIGEIISLIMNNKSVSLISDSGTPLISDPGFKLIKHCLMNNIDIDSIPGPSSVINALVISGLPTNQFIFLGFLPDKQNKRDDLLYQLKKIKYLPNIKPTVIIFVTVRKLSGNLASLKNVFGDIEIVLIREMTKKFQTRYFGKISDIQNKIYNLQGELIILF
jgi:16S rRNA (cytidine1402-2'-O)-methyltransferase